MPNHRRKSSLKELPKEWPFPQKGTLTIVYDISYDNLITYLPYYLWPTKRVVDLFPKMNLFNGKKTINKQADGMI